MDRMGTPAATRPRIQLIQGRSAQAARCGQQLGLVKAALRPVADAPHGSAAATRRLLRYCGACAKYYELSGHSYSCFYARGWAHAPITERPAPRVFPPRLLLICRSRCGAQRVLGDSNSARMGLSAAIRWPARTRRQIPIAPLRPSTRTVSAAAATDRIAPGATDRGGAARSRSVAPGASAGWPRRLAH